MKKYFFILLFSLFLLLLQGCTTLESSDFSGVVRLSRQNTDKPYRPIAAVSNSYVFDTCGGLLGLFANHHLDDLLSDISVGGTFTAWGKTYTVKTSFVYINPPHILQKLFHDHQYKYEVKVYNTAGEEIPSTCLSKEYDKDWNSEFDKNFTSENREGYYLLSFTDPETGNECLVESKYEVNCTGNFEEREDRHHDGHGEEDRHHDDHKERFTESVNVHYQAEIKVGGTVLLEGKTIVANEYNVTARVVDWNIDGIFNNEDRVNIEPISKDKCFPLGEPIKLISENFFQQLFAGKAVDDEYKMVLTPPVNGESEYVLYVERTK